MPAPIAEEILGALALHGVAYGGGDVVTGRGSVGPGEGSEGEIVDNDRVNNNAEKLCKSVDNRYRLKQCF